MTGYIIGGVVTLLAAAWVFGMFLYRMDTEIERVDLDNGERPEVNRIDYPMDHKGNL